MRTPDSRHCFAKATLPSLQAARKSKSLSLLIGLAKIFTCFSVEPLHWELFFTKWRVRRDQETKVIHNANSVQFCGRIIEEILLLSCVKCTVFPKTDSSYQSDSENASKSPSESSSSSKTSEWLNNPMRAFVFQINPALIALQNPKLRKPTQKRTEAMIAIFFFLLQVVQQITFT